MPRRWSQDDDAPSPTTMARTTRPNPPPLNTTTKARTSRSPFTTGGTIACRRIKVSLIRILEFVRSLFHPATWMDLASDRGVLATQRNGTSRKASPRAAQLERNGPRRGRSSNPPRDDEDLFGAPDRHAASGIGSRPPFLAVDLRCSVCGIWGCWGGLISGAVGMRLRMSGGRPRSGEPGVGKTLLVPGC